MEIGATEFAQYCRTVALELEERLGHMQVIVDYKLRSGTAYTEILRSFLAEHSAGKYGVAEGFIVNPFLQGHSSNHCDILVYDQIQYPLLDVEGNVKVILPRAASMVVDVESYLNEERLERSFETVQCARRVYPYVSGIIFGFNGIEPQVMFEFMQSHATSWDSATAPIAVFNMEKGFVAYRSKLIPERIVGDSPFEVFELKGATTTASLEFLFMLFFEMQMRTMLASGALDQAWKRLLAAGKAEYLGRISMPH